MIPCSPPRAVIFDLDGTLADSRLDFSAMRREAAVPDGVGLLEHMDALDCAIERQRVAAVIDRHEMSGAEAASWIAGAEEVLHAIHQRGLPTAIVTRNSRAAARRTMLRLMMPDIPLKAREDAPPKPDPAALLALAEEWQLAPADIAFVGDFHYDIEAAQRAGMIPLLFTAGRPIEAPREGFYLLPAFSVLLDWLDRRQPVVDSPHAHRKETRE